MCAEKINNTFYDDLGEMWYQAHDHPIALLRAENEVRTPWIIEKIEHHFSQKKCKILDLACGAGFLSNQLALQGHEVTGIDLSSDSLRVAQSKDRTKTVNYFQADAYDLPFQEQNFDVICSMDFLEHVEQPDKVIQQIAKVLKKDGLFFFHTFNRNLLSWLVVLKGVEWFVKNSPKHLHLFRLFIKPKELEYLCNVNQIVVKEFKGLAPSLKRAFWKMLITRKVPKDFNFNIVSSTLTSYFGYGVKIEL